MKNIRFLILPMCAAAALSSCVVPADVAVGTPGVSVGYYDTLPVGYADPYYYYGNHYYYGGVWETGRYRWHGRYYGGRYRHNGHYYYGGRYNGGHRHDGHHHH